MIRRSHRNTSVGGGGGQQPGQRGVYLIHGIWQVVVARGAGFADVFVLTSSVEVAWLTLDEDLNCGDRAGAPGLVKCCPGQVSTGEPRMNGSGTYCRNSGCPWAVVVILSLPASTLPACRQGGGGGGVEPWPSERPCP